MGERTWAGERYLSRHAWLAIWRVWVLCHGGVGTLDINILRVAHIHISTWETIDYYGCCTSWSVCRYYSILIRWANFASGPSSISWLHPRYVATKLVIFISKWEIANDRYHSPADVHQSRDRALTRGMDNDCILQFPSVRSLRVVCTWFSAPSCPSSSRLHALAVIVSHEARVDSIKLKANTWKLKPWFEDQCFRCRLVDYGTRPKVKTQHPPSITTFSFASRPMSKATQPFVEETALAVPGLHY